MHVGDEPSSDVAGRAQDDEDAPGGPGARERGGGVATTGRGHLELPDACHDLPLEPGESVWATVPGSAGDVLVATDRRLFHCADPGESGRWRAWRFEELSEIRPIGARPGDAPGRFVIEDSARAAPLVSFAIDPLRREDAMQAVTIVQLLIARARRHRSVSATDEERTAAIEAAVRRRRESAGGTGTSGSGGLTPRSADPTTRSQR